MRVRRGLVAMGAASALWSLTMGAAAAAELLIACPTRAATVKIVGAFAGEWRAPAHAARFEEAKIGAMSGAPALICSYVVDGARFHVFRRPPAEAAACEAGRDGFACRPEAAAEAPPELVGATGTSRRVVLNAGPAADAPTTGRLRRAARLVAPAPTVDAAPSVEPAARLSQGGVSGAPLDRAARGLLVVPPAWTADLDRARIGAGRDSDLWLSVSENGADRYLAPQNGAEVALLGRATPNPAACRSAALGAAPIDLRATPTGAFVCFRTSEGRVGYFQIVELETARAGAVRLEVSSW